MGARAKRFGGILVLAACAVAVSAVAAEAQMGAKVNDAQIAHIAVTANAIDIDMAQLAKSRSSSEAVRQFAQTMITDHTAVNGQAAALAKKLGVTPEENEVSRSLEKGAAEAKSSLESAAGAAFDRAYMEREVGYHEAVLGALDDVLIPGATNAELKALLEKVRPAIAMHLERARAILGGLSGGR